ncbi:hypothetical protein JCM3765_002325 [Sporobolomyces pararoseus]
MAPSLPHPHLPHHHHHSPSSAQPPQDSTSSTSAKGQHYAQTLDLARRLSLFDVQFPAELKTGNITRRATSTGEGAGMDWNELLRKFRKHNPQRTLTASAAQTDQVLHSLLLKTPATASEAAERTEKSSSLPPLPPILSPSHQPAALTSLAALQASLHSNQSSLLEQTSARIVLSFGKYLVGEFEEALSGLQGVDLEPPRSGGPVELYDLTLRVLGNAVRGFCIERLGQPLQEAREAYRIASRQYDQAVETISKSTSTLGARDDVSLHRIGETVLWRLCHLDLSISAPHLAYTSHLAYIRQSSLYHSTLPPNSTKSPLTPYDPSRSLSIHSQFHHLSLSTSNHTNSSLSNKAEEALLRKTTSLPKAGEVNKPYLRFLDQVVERWRANGSSAVEANEVIETLYNALTHTFQSHRLLRYLVRALTIAIRYVEAGKALKLYLELFEKARETDAKRVAEEMKRLRKRAGVDPGTPRNEKLEENLELNLERNEEEEEHDIDSDREFIEIGTFGVRLLCRYLEKPKEALKIAERMKKIRDDGREAGLKEDVEVRGKVEMSLGLALSSLANKEANPETRPTQHASALAHLELASTLLPTSFHALYHLSFQLFELRQISRALETAKQAVSIDKRNKQGWHLLGLVLTAMKDMKGALQVFETAIDLDNESEDEEPGNGNVGDTQDALAKLEGIKTSSRRTNESDRWEYPPTETEKLEQEVQLRLSKNVVIEYLEGPASALEDQQEILNWFSRAYLPIADALLLASPPPVATTTGNLNGEGTSSNLSKRKSLLGRRVSLRSKRDSSALPPPIPSSTLSVPPGLSPPSTAPSPYASALPSRATSRAASRNPSTVDLSLQNPTIPIDRSKPDVLSNPKATKLLVDIWLASAASFRRAGKLEESRGAIWEAEQLNADDPDVWSQLAAVHIAKGDVKEARIVLQKAFSFKVDHLPSIVQFSRLYLTPPPPPPSATTTSSTSPSWVHTQLPFAESLLETLTKKQGWDCPDAWFELSKCYKHTNRREKEKECLVWSLQLEETRSLRNLETGLDRIL